MHDLPRRNVHEPPQLDVEEDSRRVPLARRADVTLVPVGIDGAFDAWPRSALLPWLSPIHVCIGEPLGPDQVR